MRIQRFLFDSSLTEKPNWNSSFLLLFSWVPSRLCFSGHYSPTQNASLHFCLSIVLGDQRTTVSMLDQLFKSCLPVFLENLKQLVLVLLAGYQLLLVILQPSAYLSTLDFESKQYIYFRVDNFGIKNCFAILITLNHLLSSMHKHHKFQSLLSSQIHLQVGP